VLEKGAGFHGRRRVSKERAPGRRGEIRNFPSIV